MAEQSKLLVIMIDETDMWQNLTLYEAICRKMVQLNAPGATVQAGIMGFGSHHRIHRKRLFGVPDDRPISIFVVATETELRERIIPAVRPMVTEGLVFLTAVEVL